MSTGGTSIDPDQTVLRRIPITNGYYESTKVPPVQAGAFRPNKGDDDGLSCYLERALSLAELVAGTPKPPDTFAVARLRYGDLLALGVSLVPKVGPGDLPGHHIMPEINWSTYNDDNQRARTRELCKALTSLANRGIIYPPHLASATAPPAF